MTTQQYQIPALPQGLRYYILRNNAMVPLIPTDQLPFQVQGIPRQLSHRQLSDEDWKLLVETNATPAVVPVQVPTKKSRLHSCPIEKTQFLAPDHHVRSEAQSSPPDYPRTLRWTHTPPDATTTSTSHSSLGLTVTERPGSLADSFASIYQKDAQRLGYRTPYPSGLEPDPSKKEYCTHWIKTGECAFISIGCKYKHEMPPVDKLRELGFTQGMPRWWKEKSAIAARAPTWMQRRLAEGVDDEELLDLPLRREFPDPSTFRNKTVQCETLGSRQHSSSRFKLDPSGSGAKTSDPVPLSSTQAVDRRGAVSDLLIDFDNSPAPHPSPQLSSASSTTYNSLDAPAASSRSSMSPPPSSVVGYAPVVVHGNKIASNVAKAEKRVEDPAHQTNPRPNSRISWASQSEDDTKPAKLVHKHKSVSRKPPKRVVMPAKQTGLASSKHAPGSVRTPARNAETHVENAKARVRVHESNEFDAPELHAKIEKLRAAAHLEDAAKKMAASPERRVRGAHRLAAPVKHVLV